MNDIKMNEFDENNKNEPLLNNDIDENNNNSNETSLYEMSFTKYTSRKNKIKHRIEHEINRNSHRDWVETFMGHPWLELAGCCKCNNDHTYIERALSFAPRLQLFMLPWGWFRKTPWLLFSWILFFVFTFTLCSLIYTDGPESIRMMIGSIHIDVGSALNAFISPVVMITCFRLSNDPIVAALINIIRNLNPEKACNCIHHFYMSYIGFFCLVIVLDIVSMVSYEDKFRVIDIAYYILSMIWKLMMASAFAFWILCAELLLILIDETGQSFSKQSARFRVLEILEKNQTRTLKFRDLVLPDRSQEESVVCVNEAVHTHHTLTKLMQGVMSHIQWMILGKLIVDITVMLVAIGKVVENQHSIFLLVFIIVVCTIVVVYCLLPVALITSAYQNLISYALYQRPWAKSRHESANLEAIISYLQNFQNRGAMLFGIVITTSTVATVCSVMYTLFIASNIVQASSN